MADFILISNLKMSYVRIAFMKSILIYIVNNLTSLLPQTRFYKLKAIAYRLCGFDIHETVRVVSSVNFWGNIKLKIGRGTFIGHNGLILGGESLIIIGNDVDIAPRLTLVTGSHQIDMLGSRTAGNGYSNDVVIEDGAWIGANVTILGGVVIGSKSIIGAGSVVTKSIPANVIAVGNPCRSIRIWSKNQGWKEIV